MKTNLTPTPPIAIDIAETSHRIQPESDYIDFFIDVEEKEYRYIDIGFEFGYLGTVDKGVIDFDVTEYLIDRIDIDNSNYDNAYFHFGDNKTTGWSAENCFLSLLESHSLSLDKKHLIIKPKN